jgi:Mor family transcriptional regulator
LSEKNVDVDYKSISHFLDQSPTNQDEKEILTLVTDLHNLSSLFIAQEIIGNNESKETKKQMQSIVETLESKYKMNIK